MSISSVNISDSNMDIISFQKFKTYNSSSNTEDIEKMKKILFKAIKYELTHMQKLCITEHYLEGRKMKDIAHELNLHPSTITRHIQAGKKKLENIAKYY